MTTYCPATMCPLIAPEGSPWTGQKNSPCEGAEAVFKDDKYVSGCAWFNDGHCVGCAGAHQQIGEAADGSFVAVLGPNKPKRQEARASRDYDCPRAGECQWQIEADAENGLCPPRSALRLGLDPRLSLF